MTGQKGSCFPGHCQPGGGCREAGGGCRQACGLVEWLGSQATRQTRHAKSVVSYTFS